MRLPRRIRRLRRWVPGYRKRLLRKLIEIDRIGSWDPGFDFDIEEALKRA